MSIGVLMAGSKGYCRQSVQFFNRASVLTPIRKLLYDRMIRSLVASGVWQKLDVLYVFAAPDNTTALTNLVSSSFSGIISGHVPTFTADQGFTGNGSSAYIDSQFVPSTAGGNFTQNNCHISFWDLSSRTVANAGIHMGTIGSSVGNTQAAANFTANEFLIQMTAGASANVSEANAQGHHIASRTDSSNMLGYKNGAQALTSATASNGLSDHSILILCRNSSVNTAQQFTSDEIASASIGGGLSSSDSLVLYTALQRYLHAIGAV